MTTTDFLHEKVGESKTGWISGIPVDSENQLTCFCKPTKDLLRFTVFSDTLVQVGASFDILHASIEGLGMVTLFGNHVVKTGGAAPATQKFQIDIVPSLIIEGHLTLNDLKCVSSAQLTISTNRNELFSEPFHVSETNITKAPSEFRSIFSTNGLRIKVGSYLSYGDEGY